MTAIREQSLQIFLDQLASRQATPGGGSVAALLGAQAAALVAMVCNLTIGKPKYAAVAETMQDLLTQAENLRAELTDMIKADVDVFNKLMACYALPKTTDAEKAARAEAIQTVLQEATDVPLACARACATALELSLVAAEHGSLGVISDAGVAAVAAHAGLKSAALNVQVNAAGLKDREFAEQRLQALQAIEAKAEPLVLSVYQMVKNKL